MLSKAFFPYLFAGLMLSACGGSTNDTSNQESPNAPPTITANFQPVTEKSAVNLSVSATASNGTIDQYSWQQTSGPEVVLTGHDSASVSFVAPTISINSEIEFNISVTDSHGQSTSINASVSIERIETAFTLTGAVIEPAFANASVIATVAGEIAEVTADQQGNFNLQLMVDDDVSTEQLVRLSAKNADGLELTSLLPSLVELSLVELPIPTKQTADIQTHSISSISTAQYSLLTLANNGEEPNSVEQVRLAEMKIDADALMESAAVAKLLIDDASISLPDGSTDIVSLLTDTLAYNRFIKAITATNPDIISEMQNVISNDPAFKPTISPDSLPAIYYPLTPVEPTLMARSGSQYEFFANMDGSFTNHAGPLRFNWEIDAGDIVLTYLEYIETPQYIDISLIPGLTDEQRRKLYDAGILWTPTDDYIETEKLTKLNHGRNIDIYQIEVVTRHNLLPITLPDETISVDSWTSSATFNTQMQQALPMADRFSAEAMTGLWGVEVYKPDAEGLHFFNHFEVIELYSDGTGMSQDSNEDFNWSVNEGLLQLSFSEFNQSYQITNNYDENLSVYSQVTDKNEQLVSVLRGYAAKLEEGMQFTPETVTTGSDKYWQALAWHWSTKNWNNNHLHFCSNGLYIDEGCKSAMTPFGFSFLSDQTAARVLPGYGSVLPPNFQHNHSYTTHWSINNDNHLIHAFTNIDENCLDELSYCRYREWKLVKTTEGRLGKRIYVQETDWIKYQYEFDYRYFIAPRLHIYELIDFEYFNDVAKEEQAFSEQITSFDFPMTPTKVLEPRLILNPSQSPNMSSPLH